MCRRACSTEAAAAPAPGAPFDSRALRAAVAEGAAAQLFHEPAMAAALAVLELVDGEELLRRRLADATRAADAGALRAALDAVDGAELFLAEYLGGRAEPFETADGATATFPLQSGYAYEPSQAMF